MNDFSIKRAMSEHDLKNLKEMRKNIELRGGGTGLKEVLRTHKVEKIKNLFISKLKRNFVYRKPVNYEPFESSATGTSN